MSDPGDKRGRRGFLGSALLAVGTLAGGRLAKGASAPPAPAGKRAFPKGFQWGAAA